MSSTRCCHETKGIVAEEGYNKSDAQEISDYVEDDAWIELNNWNGSCYAHRALHKSNVNIVQTLGPRRIDNKTSQQQDKTGGLDYNHVINQSNAGRECPIPEYVVCMLTIKIQRAAGKDSETSSTRHMYSRPIQFPWLWSAVYRDLYEIMRVFVGNHEPRTKRFYLGSSHVRLMAWNSTKFIESDSRTVETGQQWERQVPEMIAHYCGDGSSEKMFYLEINSNFEWFIVEPFGPGQNQRYKQSIPSTLKETKSTNHDKKEYWAKKVLKGLFDLETIRKIVDDYYDKKEGRPTYLPAEERPGFVEWLWNDRVRLLAIIIHCNTTLDRLRKLRQLELDNPGKDEYKIGDEKIPLSDADLDLFLEIGEATTFREVQGGFKPINFPQPGTWEHQVMQDKQIVPIYFDNSTLLGEGGSGSSVYAAVIHPDYHAYSTNKNDTFALKILTNSVKNNAQEEMKAWQYVADQPHNHITTFYTSWSQNGRFYMLSPRADMSLRDFLFDEDTEPFEKNLHTEWLLEQVEGLASGVQHIHHIGRAGLRPHDSSGRKIDCGYHHDLKPDNILVFSKRIWKISDFGTAKIRLVVSSSATVPRLYTKNFPRGDEEYGSPDYPVHNVGRSYDIWSLGCILLEVLLWVFGEGNKHLQKFRTDRSDEVQDSCDSGQEFSQEEDAGSDQHTDSDDAILNDPMPNFWFHCKKCGKNHLKKCVKAKLDWVKSQAENDCRLLTPLCELVEKMLSIHPKMRPPASAVSDKIGTLRVRAKVYFAHQRRVALEQGEDLQTSDGHTGSMMLGVEVDTRTLVQSVESRSRHSSPDRQKSASKSDRVDAVSFDSAKQGAHRRGQRKRPRSPADTVRDVTGAGRHVEESLVADVSPKTPASTVQASKRRNTTINTQNRKTGVVSGSFTPSRSSTQLSSSKNVPNTRSRPSTRSLAPSSNNRDRDNDNEDEDTQPFPELDNDSTSVKDPTWIAKKFAELEDDTQP